MRNNLNSVLLEGVLVGNPVKDRPDNGRETCYLTLSTTSCFGNAGQASEEEEVSVFDIEVKSKALIDACSAKGRGGARVRVCGKLKQKRWKGPFNEDFSRIVVIAEHLEFKRNDA